MHDAQFAAAVPGANFFDSVLPQGNPTSAASLFGSPEFPSQQQHNATQFSVGNIPSSTEMKTYAPLETEKFLPDRGQATTFFNREPGNVVYCCFFLNYFPSYVPNKNQF